MAITLTLVKAHLNIEDGMLTPEQQTQTDAYLKHLIEVATDVTERYLNVKFCVEYGDGDLPSPVTHAILMTIGTMYANRESESDKAMTHIKTYEMLLNAYKNFTVG